MFIQQSKLGDNTWWKYLLMILALFIAYAILGAIPLTWVFMNKQLGLDEIAAFQENMDFAALGIDENIGLLLVLSMFVFSFITLVFLYPLLHKKRVKSMVTARPSIDWSRVFYAFGLWFGLTLFLEILAYFIAPENYVYQLDLSKFIPLLIIALLILPIQTSFEELLFRGYLLQGFSLIGRYRWVPILITSVLFGLMHISNPEVQKFGTATMMSYYIGIGLFLAICTVMDDGMEIALGIHAATNIYGATMVSFSGSALQTPTIFRLTEMNVQLMLVMSLVMALVFLYLLSKKYNWTDWSKLTGPIIFEKEEGSRDEQLIA